MKYIPMDLFVFSKLDERKGCSQKGDREIGSFETRIENVTRHSLSFLYFPGPNPAQFDYTDQELFLLPFSLLFET